MSSFAAESRVTLTTNLPNGQQLHTNFDNATKLISFNHPNASVAAVTTKPDAATTGSIEVKGDGQKAVTYWIEAGKDVIVEIDGGKVKVTATKK